MFAPLLLLLFVLHRCRLVDYRSTGQLVSLVPDWLGGIYVRRAWYASSLARCGAKLTVSWLSVIEQQASHVGSSVYVGPGCSIGWVQIGDEVLIGAGTLIVSGMHQHGFKSRQQPIRQQAGGAKTRVSIGSDVWIGAACVIGGNVPDGGVVAMGSVVTGDLDPPYGIFAGAPARLVSERT